MIFPCHHKLKFIYKCKMLYVLRTLLCVAMVCLTHCVFTIGWPINKLLSAIHFMSPLRETLSDPTCLFIIHSTALQLLDLIEKFPIYQIMKNATRQ